MKKLFYILFCCALVIIQESNHGLIMVAESFDEQVINPKIGDQIIVSRSMIDLNRMLMNGWRVVAVTSARTGSPYWCLEYRGSESE